MRETVGDAPRRLPQHSQIEAGRAAHARFIHPNIVGLWHARHTTPHTSSLIMSQKNQIIWHREDVVHLIELYKDNVCLWQVKHYSYKNRNARDAALRKILDCLKKQMPDVTSSDIKKKKLHTLRSQYRREMKLVKESSKSGAGAEEIYKPKLWCFDAFGFLYDGEEIRESISTLDLEEDEVRKQCISFIIICYHQIYLFLLHLHAWIFTAPTWDFI